MKMTAGDLVQLGVIDEVLPEPFGGAHTDWETTADVLREALTRHLFELSERTPEDLLPSRWEKYLAMGEFRTA